MSWLPDPIEMWEYDAVTVFLYVVYAVGYVLAFLGCALITVLLFGSFCLVFCPDVLFALKECL